MSTTNPIDLTQPVPPAPADEVVQRPMLDRIGISASVLCAIHCIVAPFLLLLLPAAGTVWSHPAVHWVLAALVLPLALWVLYKGYTRHRSQLTLVAASMGGLLILAGLVAPMVHASPILELPMPSFFGELVGGNDAAPVCTETCCPVISHGVAGTALAMPPGGLLTLIGSVFLITAHGSNLLSCRQAAKGHLSKADNCSCPA
ncbi:MAG: MerC domain-containing protein [Planctomycetota bacterium]